MLIRLIAPVLVGFIVGSLAAGAETLLLGRSGRAPGGTIHYLADAVLLYATAGVLLGLLIAGVTGAVPRLRRSRGAIEWGLVGAIPFFLVIELVAQMLARDMGQGPSGTVGLLGLGVMGLAAWWALGERFLAPLRAKWGRVGAAGMLVAVGLVGYSATRALGQDPEGERLEAPNILLVVLDTTRKDRISCYWDEEERKKNPVPLTPHLDALAAEGIRYDNAISPSPWTFPSHASIFTGLYPSEHGATEVYPRLLPGFETMAELLQAQGYQTVALPCNTVWLNAARGFDQGFDDFVDVSSVVGTPYEVTLPKWPESRCALRHVWSALFGGPPLVTSAGRDPARSPDKLGQTAVELADHWLADRWKRDKPFFMFVNFLEPHEPYNPPPGFCSEPAPAVITDQADWANEDAFYLHRFLTRVGQSAAERRSFQVHGRVNMMRALAGQLEMPDERLAQIQRDYGDEIRYMDHRFGQLIESLERYGVKENTLIIVVSDHGESLGELRGGAWMYDHARASIPELVNVPLLVRYPGSQGRDTASRVVKRRVSALDIFPTVLQAVGIAYNPRKADAGPFEPLPLPLSDDDPLPKEPRVILSQPVFLSGTTRVDLENVIYHSEQTSPSYPKKPTWAPTLPTTNRWFDSVIPGEYAKELADLTAKLEKMRLAGKPEGEILVVQERWNRSEERLKLWESVRPVDTLKARLASDTFAESCWEAEGAREWLEQLLQTYEASFHVLTAPRMALYRGDWKLLWSAEPYDTWQPALYNLRDDPDEKHNLMGALEAGKGTREALEARDALLKSLELFYKKTATFDLDSAPATQDPWKELRVVVPYG